VPQIAPWFSAATSCASRVLLADLALWSLLRSRPLHLPVGHTPVGQPTSATPGSLKADWYGMEWAKAPADA
jgi:hypothetical protein